MKKNVCPDCGPIPVIHWVERWSVIIDWACTPFYQFVDAVLAFFHPLLKLVPWQSSGPAVFRILTAFHLGTVRSALDDMDNARTRAMWESATARGIVVKEFRLLGRPQASFFTAEWNGSVRTFEGLPRPAGSIEEPLEWLDDKWLVKKKFSAAGVPVARGGACVRFAKARELFRELRCPVIVKPHIGSRSRHTFVHVTSEETLRTSFLSAKKLSPWVIVEEELEGPVFRGTLVGGRLIGIVSRDPAHVTGDGTHTVRELVEEENKKPMRQGPVYHHIPIDEEGTETLKKQGYVWESVPQKGVRVAINNKVTRTLGATMIDVTDETHPDTVAMLEAAGGVLNVSLVGIDFIVGDITRSWKEQERCGVIECNSLPFIDLHHYPVSGTPRDVAGALWELVFPELKIN